MIRTITILAGLYMLIPLYSQEELTLSGALGRAMDNNYGIIISRAEQEIASINNHWGNAGRYPTVG